MRYFSNKFSKISPRAEALRTQRPSILNFGELKPRNLAKPWFYC